MQRCRANGVGRAFAFIIQRGESRNGGVKEAERRQERRSNGKRSTNEKRDFILVC